MDERHDTLASFIKTNRTTKACDLSLHLINIMNNNVTYVYCASARSDDVEQKEDSNIDATEEKEMEEKEQEEKEEEEDDKEEEKADDWDEGEEWEDDEDEYTVETFDGSFSIALP
jgi:hypothetical protein